ncbi:MAG: DUF2203 domain-containing protein [Phycisphaerales bacterium]|nr:DUF2203 domain-containing protein [Phycisphaerales bacterium]
MEVSGATSTKRPVRLHTGQKIFTLEDANRTLPLVSKIMADVVEQDKRVCMLEEHCQAPGPGVTKGELEELRERYVGELDKLWQLREELSAIGCQLKDWRRGIVDFLAIYQGRLVELCWRFGEEKIEHWHEVDAGYRGRQPINEVLFSKCSHIESKP